MINYYDETIYGGSFMKKTSFSINIKSFITKIENKFDKIYNLKQSIIIIALLSLFSVIFQAIIQNGITYEALINYLGYIKSPLLILFNFLPIFLFTMIFYFLLNSIPKSFIIVNLPLTLLLIVNHYKIFFRDTPLTLNDFSSTIEALSIVQNYNIEFSFRIFLLTLIMTLLFVFLIKYIHNEKVQLKIRLVGILASLILIFISYIFIYQNTELYKTVSTPQNEYYDVAVVNSKGLLYSLISKENLQTIYTKPEGYSDEKISQLINTYTTVTNDNKTIPNVIAIMSEAFFDPREASNLKFYQNKNPLKNYDELKKDGYYGNIIVPGFAGATASTEFEFLTGMNIFSIDSSMPEIYKTHINTKVYSIVDIFNKLNYRTLAIHPGFNWFYNRNSVYKYMGFDDMIFKDSLPKNVEQVNYYISDTVTADLIIDNYKNHLETNPNQGYFNFTITIQNHGPYMDYETDRAPSIIKPENMDETRYNIVNNYINGLSDADNLLGKVKDYISTLDNPTVLLFFGDHLPYFDSELKAYDEIGYNITDSSLESIKLKYSTPYIIWSNEAFKNLTQEQNRVLLKGKGEDISSNYLSLELLKYISMDLPPFFNFLNNLKNKVNAITPNYYLVDNKFELELSDELNEKLNNYRIWEYYNLRKQSN